MSAGGGERLRALDGRRSCRLTTRGRRSGRPHSVTVWFAVLDDSTLGLSTLKLDRDWPKNLRANGEAVIRIGDLELRGEARFVENDEAARARIERSLRRKYLVSRILGWLGRAPEGVFEVRIRETFPNR